MSEQRFYTEEEAHQILALANKSPLASGNAMSRDEILRTAAEMGISPEAVASAERELREKNVETAEWQEYRDHVSRAHLQNVGSWIGSSILLIGINLLTSPGRWWFIWPVGIWGLVVLGTVIEHMMTKPWNDRAKFDKWRRRKNRDDDDDDDDDD